METTGYTECYIAFLDILGFKNLVNRQDKSCNDIVNIYKLLMDHVNQLSNNYDYEYNDGYKVLKDVKFKIMSDSICLYIKKDIPDSLAGLVLMCSCIQGVLLELKFLVLVRGAITVGNIYAQDDITFGPGLTAAYLMEEKNAKYPRIIMTRQVYESGENNLKDFDIEFYHYLAYEDYDKFLCVAITLKHGTAKTLFENAYKQIREVLDTTTDDSIRNKYLYLENVIREFSKLAKRQQNNE